MHGSAFDGRNFMSLNMLWMTSAHLLPDDSNRTMSKLKVWTLQSSLLTLWMEKTRVNNQTKIDDDGNLLKTL